ncbi:MAG: SulP family inorganic anion transporter [Chitinophagales bacterium]|nr:SulP family inorganic anion transporter [Chitinophagales bacterium]
MSNKSWISSLKYDLPAGLVVYLVALPLCLGIAAASTGRPDLLFSGIIAGVVGGIVVGFFSGSQLGVSGPAAGLVTIVSAGIASAGSYQAFLLAVVLAGALQLIAGFLKAGVIGHYFPSSVIKGMLAAIGIILILKQLPHALGYDKDLMGDLDFEQKDGHNTFTELYYALRYNSTGAIVISVISVSLLLLFDTAFMKRFGLFKFVPGSLFVVLAGIALNLAFSLFNPSWVLSGDHLVQLPVAKSIADFFSFFTFPDFSAISNPKVFELALTLAIVASLESLLSVEATDKLDPFKRNTPTNRELKAQGLGNMVSGLLGGLPITQVIVRSSANINSGGRTKISAITHGIILLLSAIIIPQFINLIPMAALACILLLVGYKLARVQLFSAMYRLGWEQFLPFIVTIVAIVGTDLLRGIALGFCVSIFFILRKNYKHSYYINKSTGSEIRLQLSEEVTFLNKGSILQTLHHLPENASVVVDGSRSVHIDYDVAEAIYEFKNHTAALKNIKVELIGIPENEKAGGH